MMDKKYDVIVTASYSIDLIFNGLPKLPELGGEVISRGFEMLPGESFTSAVAMHRLGLKVGWAGDFGNDEFSQFALDRARQEGLDDSLFVHHARPMRRVSVAASLPSDRAFITYYDPDPPIPAAVKALGKVSARVLYIPGLFFGPLFDAGRQLAHLKGMQVVMDGNTGEGISLQDPLRGSSVRKAIQGLDVLLPNAREARCLTGEDDLLRAIQVLARLCPLVVIKDGARGALACREGDVVHAPALSLEPLDTTGAGDCFSAGFIKAWLDGLPLLDCLRWGNIAGGLSTLGHGGTGRRVTGEDIQQYMQQMKNSD